MASNTNAQDDQEATLRKAAESEQLWLVSYSDTDDRELTTSEIVAALKRGEITLYSLAWREGMLDWQPIANIEELRAPAGLLIKPFISDKPPAPAPSQGKAEEELEVLSSSDVISSPPSGPAEADFLGLEDPDTSLAPPRIDHAAFFMSQAPPGDKGAALPALPRLGGAAAPAAPTPRQQGALGKAMPAPVRWLLLMLAAGAAGVAGFIIGGPSEAPAPPMPAVVAQAVPAQEIAQAEIPQAEIPQPSEQATDEPGATGQAKPTPGAVAGTPTQTTASKPLAATPASDEPSTAPATPATPTPATPAPAPRPVVASNDPFDKAAAGAALSQAAARASGCRQPGDPSGTAQVEVTFAPSGRATRALISGPPFVGTKTGSCIAQELRKASVPPFKGDLVTVQKRVVIQ